MNLDRPVNPARRPLASLSGDGWRRPWLLLACAALLLPCLGGDALRALWRYDRAAVVHGEAWRLVTAHVVHLDLGHALLNTAGLALLWALFAGVLGRRQLLFALCGALACIDAGFWFLQPQLEWYVGASGVLHGVMAAGTLQLLRLRDPIAALTAALLAAKLAWEQWVGPLPLETRGTVIVAAHLYGAIGGLAAAALPWGTQLAIMRAHQGRGGHD
jgi:rhomboid family GlyGly-CTERM serine protease